MDPVWAAVIAALGASFLTSLGTRYVAGFQARRAAEEDTRRRTHELERDRQGDERHLRDAKAERVRQDVVALALAADAFEYVGKQAGFLGAGDTREARAQRLNKVLGRATETLGPAVMRLELEPGMEAAVEVYKRVRKAFVAFTIGLEMMEARPRYVPSDIVENLNTLEAGVPDIIAKAKARLADLETPL